MQGIEETMMEAEIGKEKKKRSLLLLEDQILQGSLS